MNNKNVYSLTIHLKEKFEWIGKERMVKWVKKFPGAKNLTFLLCGNPHALVPVYVCEVYLNGTGTRVHSCKRLRPCASVPNLWLRCGRPQIIHTSMEMAAFSGMSTRVCVFEGIVYVDWKHRIGSDIGWCSKKNIGHRIGRQNCTSVDP